MKKLPSKEQAEADTPQVSADWSLRPLNDRLNLIAELLKSRQEFGGLAVSRLKDDGSVFFEMESPIPPADRGITLRRLEVLLKAKIDPGLTVWIEPKGDKNALRRLRGVKVKF